MADTLDTTRADLEKQIADLKTELGRISKSLSARASDAMEDAGDLYEQGKGRARQAAAHVRDQTHVAVEAMRENPATTATILSAVGLLALSAGFVLGSICSGDNRR